MKAQDLVGKYFRELYATDEELYYIKKVENGLAFYDHIIFSPLGESIAGCSENVNEFLEDIETGSIQISNHEEYKKAIVRNKFRALKNE